MALVSCSQCQSEVSDRAVSCPHCGNVFTRCPECRNDVQAGDSACKNCGYPLGVALPMASQYSAQFLSAQPPNYLSDGVADTLIYAGFWRRFAAFLIDFVVLTVVFFVTDVLFALLFGSARPRGVDSGLSLGVTIAYYVALESSGWQATLGKRALGIVVTDLYGNRISPKRAIGRYFARWLSALTLLIGYFMAGFTEKKQALHDMMAGTLVVVKPTRR